MPLPAVITKSYGQLDLQQALNHGFLLLNFCLMPIFNRYIITNS